MKTTRYTVFAGLLGLLAALIGGAQGAIAATWQDLRAIEQGAEQYLRQVIDVAADETLTIAIGHLDSRLQLPACSKPLVYTQPNHNQRLGLRTLKVQCLDAQLWQLYLSVTVSMTKPVYVARTALAKGTRLTPADITLKSVDLTHCRHGCVSSPQRLLGLVLRRAVNANKPLTPQLVHAPTLIKRGQAVHIVAHTGGIEVSHKGKAMSDGALGDVIAVKNLTSKREIEGVITGAGVIKIQI